MVGLDSINPVGHQQTSIDTTVTENVQNAMGGCGVLLSQFADDSMVHEGRQRIPAMKTVLG